MYIAVGVVLAALLFCVAAAKLYLVHSGTEEIVVKLTERTPFAVAARDERSVTLVTKMEFANVGKQVGTIMDAFVRPLLPYEQYDGLEVRGRAEREGAKALAKLGAKEVYAACSHEILTDPAIERINASVLKQLIVTDTIPLGAKKSDKIVVLTIADAIGDVLISIQEHRSVSHLFR